MNETSDAMDAALVNRHLLAIALTLLEVLVDDDATDQERADAIAGAKRLMYAIDPNRTPIPQENP